MRVGEYAPTPRRRQEKLNEAAEAGLTVVYGNDRTLLLDLDSQEEANAADLLIETFGPALKVTSIIVTRSKSRNWHYYLVLTDPLPLEQRLFWQAVLGSDRKRAGLDWLFYKAGHEGETLLFETEAGVATLRRRGIIECGSS